MIPSPPFPSHQPDSASDPPLGQIRSGDRGVKPERPAGHLSSAYFAPMLGRRGRLVLGIISALWLISAALAVSWWLSAVRAPTTEGLILNSGVLAFDAVVLPLWILFFARRMRRPLPDPEEHSSREIHSGIAMVVTKAPSERWEIVQGTLRAMLAQDYLRPYDVWLADEDPDRETESWCETHGIGITTRRGIPEYNRDDWPRRARCKEGNLAYFYDTVGYKNYDVVAQLDADHVPATGYLRHMVAPFADPRVGYVAAPSICDNNAQRSWSARGRLYSEALLQGAIQAGCNGGWAPSCIGSHYAVRTAALKEIGGLGPELAEDFSTTMMMAAGRWEGAFAIDAEAHGDGPESVADCVTQDFQWSRSMITLGLTLARRELPKATWRARLRLGSCLAWYPLYALTMVAAFLIPVIALLTGEALVRVQLTAFYQHLLIPLVLLIAAGYWLRYLGGLRPRDAKIISWEVILFHLVRWPWAFLGSAQAVIGRITGRQLRYKVTPKGRIDKRPLPLKVIMPYLVVSLISGLSVVLVRDPENAVGYYFLALVNTVLYLVVAAAVTILHMREQSWTLPGRKSLLIAPLTAVSFVAASALAVNGATAVDAVTHPGPPPEGVAKPSSYTARPSPYAPKTDPRARVAIGVTTNAGARNVSIPWVPSQLNQANSFERAIRANADIIMWFSDWSRGEVDRRQLEAVAARGSVPEITWEPFDRAVGLNRPQHEYSMSSIAAGEHDKYIRQWADELRDFGKPVMLRFAHEMNVPATGYPWAQPEQNSAGEYVAAWRHIHGIFESRKAANVRWVWSPLASVFPVEYYPGDRYVDVIGFSGFNGGSALPWNGWRSFRRIFEGALAQAERIAPDKPLQISEVSTAVGSGSKAEWVTSMFRTVEDHPQIRSVVWFNAPKQTDWRIQSSPAAEKAFSEAIRKPRYGGMPYSAVDASGR
jgi:cellulose synthase (UDP-forming)